jgi:serine/threonine protein kinase
MIGTTIAHYRIEAELGRRGMGVVYRAHDERLHRKVALKVLPEQIASHTERRARILAEARSGAALKHPGIATICEVAEEEEQLFIVMELVSGTKKSGIYSYEQRKHARFAAQQEKRFRENKSAWEFFRSQAPS